MKMPFHSLRPIALAAFLAGALLTSTQAAAKRINPDNPADPLAAKIYQLDNGLTIYLSENHQTPRFEAHIAVRAGSKHDPAESTGLAHYLEHMLFKGTQRLGTLDYDKERPYLDKISALYEQHFKESDPDKRKAIYKEINANSQLAAQFAIPNEMDKLYNSMGEIGLNAHTSHEETVYKVNLPSNRLDQWALIESERFQNPVFRLFQPELEIVYEEKNQTLDNKESIIHFAVGKTLFKRHPYGQQTTIGEVEHLKNPSLQNMYRFFETYYVPNNVAILISGDIDSAAAISTIEKAFAGWKSKPIPALGNWQEPPLSGAERVQVKYQGEEYVLLGFRLPGQNHPDTDAIKLVDMILDNSVAGLINLNLNQRQKVRRAGSSPEFLNDHSAHYFWGVPKKGQPLKEVEDLLLQQIQLIKSGAFEDWILPAILTDFKKNRKAGLESDAARVGMMRESFLAFQRWEDSVAELDRLQRLTKADVVRVANKYYGSNYVAGYRIDAQHEVPSIQKPEIEKINLDTSRQSAFAKSVLDRKVTEIKPSYVHPGVDFEKDSLRPGIDLYYSRNPLNDLFTLTISIEIGSRLDNKLGTAARLLDKSGTSRFSSEQLKQEWYKLGTDFSVTVGETETTITIAGLDENLKPSMALLREVLEQSQADDKTLAELKQIILAQRQDSKKDFRAIAGALALYNRYGTNSPQLKALSNTELKALSSGELQERVRSLLRYQHAIGYVGALSKDAVKALLTSWQPKDGGSLPPPFAPYMVAENVATNRVLFVQKEMAQTQLRLEFGAGGFEESTQPVVQLFNEYFSGGMSGVVFQELRETRALAYSAGALYSTGFRKKDQAFMSGQMSCQADKTAEALQAFLDLLHQLPESNERFAEARNAVLSRYRTGKLGFREVLGAVRTWERLEVTVDPRQARFSAIEKAEFPLVLDFHRKQIRDRSYLISLVGDRAKIKMDAVNKLGRVQEVQVDQLFSY